MNIIRSEDVDEINYAINEVFTNAKWELDILPEYGYNLTVYDNNAKVSMKFYLDCLKNIADVLYKGTAHIKKF